MLIEHRNYDATPADDAEASIRAARAIVRRMRDRDERADQIARELGAHRVSALLTFHGRDFREVLHHLNDALEAVEQIERQEGAP